MRKLLVPSILLAVTVLTIYWTLTAEPFAFEFGPPREFGGPFPDVPDVRPYPADLEFYYAVRTVITTINATIGVMLLVAYIDIYRKTKSQFTIGLSLFSLVLLLYALASSPLLHWVFGFRAIGLGPFAMLPDLFACVALSILLYLSLRY
jgi:hypothetical protein